ncbi:uncharacterized protein JCM15063_001567 [Sporobolomyces koalae]|uniref:uncharacterized protein n=1 Tax=Sporobolomyces koalae TaxID=500713 RepID=UPI003180CA64
MSKLLNLPGTIGKGRDGYHALSDPVKTHTVSAGGIPQSIELGDLGNDAFYDQVASIRGAIRQYDADLNTLQTKQLYSLQPHDPDVAETVSVELNQVNAGLALASTNLRKQIAGLGTQVGADEARRGHWDNLKSTLKRAVERQQSLEMAQRERVRERVARQYRIVQPNATDDEVKEILSTASDSSAPRIFQQALAGSQRSSAALSALNEAKSRQGELAQIESSLIELAQLVQQVADLVVEQDVKIVKLEHTTEGVHDDVEKALKEIQKSKLSAAATRHKKKICLAIAAIMVVVVIVVIVVQVRGSGAGSGSDASKQEKHESPAETSLPSAHM